MLSYLDVFSGSPLFGTSPRCSITKSVSFPSLECCQIQGQFCPLKSHLWVTVSKWGIFVGHERVSETERNSGRECVCSCSLVCLVQNWFKAPGHRKKATLHSRHVPETSSRGSTIAIQQRRLKTPKWVCSVLHCPTWQSATYSTSLAPRWYFSLLSSSSSFSFSASCSPSVSHLNLQS